MIEPRYTVIPVAGITRRYRLLHITDLHMTDLAGDETPERVAVGTERHEKMFDWQGIRASQRLYDYIDWAVKEKADMIVLTGDILDFPSEPNLYKLHDALQAGKIPYFYVLGNHDWTYLDHWQSPDQRALYRPRLVDLCDGNADFHYTEFPDLILAGFDNGEECFSEEQCRALDMLQKKGKPIILLCHVPFTSPTLDETVTNVWHRNISLGETGIVKGETLAFLDKMTGKGTNVRAVICGHVHFFHEDQIRETIPQYISGVASEGNCRIIDLLPV